MILPVYLISNSKASEITHKNVGFIVCWSKDMLTVNWGLLVEVTLIEVSIDDQVCKQQIGKLVKFSILGSSSDVATCTYEPAACHHKLNILDRRHQNSWRHVCSWIFQIFTSKELAWRRCLFERAFPLCSTNESITWLDVIFSCFLLLV